MAFSLPLRVSWNHINRRPSLPIVANAGSKEHYNRDSETWRHKTMVCSTLSNFANFAFNQQTGTCWDNMGKVQRVQATEDSGRICETET
jgi:hypothetical protein